MENESTFNLRESLKFYLDAPTRVPCPEADSEIASAEGSDDSLTAGQVNAILDPIVEAITDNPESIAEPENFDNLQSLLK